MKTKSIALLSGASAIALFFTACDSKQEQVREENLEQKADAIESSADQLRKDGEKVADMKEDNADAIRKNSEKAADATEENADATRKAVEKRADQIEDQADKVREQK
jgi:gas vesicle protein